MKCRKVLLSFDIEEFDFPRERGEEISVQDGVRVSREGAVKILDVLKKNDIKATFFTTGNFAKYAPEIIERMIKDGHEIAAHGVDHFMRKEKEIAEAKKILESFPGVKISGWRQPRMGAIRYEELEENGYMYDSSVNPAFIPGRYNNLKTPRKIFRIGKIIEVPASVSTPLRVPLFWLALHLFPLSLYKRLAWLALRRDGYFATYFHPWEFTDLSKFSIVPFYIQYNSGDKLLSRLDSLIKYLKKKGCEFERFSEFVTNRDE